MPDATDSMIKSYFDDAIEAARQQDARAFEIAVRSALDLDYVTSSRTAEAMLLAELNKNDPRLTGSVAAIVALSERFANREDQVAMRTAFMYELTIRRALDEPGAGDNANVLQTVIYALQMVRFLRDNEWTID